MSTLHTLTTDALDRLGDLANEVWSRDEIDLYVMDAYDTFCRQTCVLYDHFVIENLPKVGNWQTDLERYLAEQKPGWGVTDEPFHFTGEHERNLGTGGRYGGTYRGPAPATSPSERTYFDADNVESLSTDLPSLVPGGEVPNSTVEVLRVTYDNLTLQGVSSAQMRRIDPQYENRTGDPRWYIWDKDGLFYVRVVPVAGGTATYDDVDGSWGTLRYRCDDAATATLTYTGAPQAGDLISIAGIRYVFVGVMEAAEENVGKVLVSYTADDTCANLVNCINNSGSTSGTDYNAPLLPTSAGAHPYVTAAQDVSAGTITLTVRLSQNVLPYSSLTIAESVNGMTAGSFSVPSTPDDTVDYGHTGGFGILRHRTDLFPTNGPWGTPRRIHPDDDNIKVEVYRLGRDLRHHASELPTAFEKYVVYGAVAQALQREGSGQSLELAQHYNERFEMGVKRMSRKKRDMDKERFAQLGSRPQETNFGLGEAQPPYNYGEVR